MTNPTKGQTAEEFKTASPNDLNSLSDREAIAKIKEYHRNKYKNGMNSGGNQDPYLTPRCVCKRFRIDVDRCVRLLTEMEAEDNKYSDYIDPTFI